MLARPHGAEDSEERGSGKRLAHGAFDCQAGEEGGAWALGR
jgi:hypothetical protein